MLDIARIAFAAANEIFLTNVLIDPSNPNSSGLDQVKASLQEKYPSFSLHFDPDNVVHPKGAIFDSENYARWENIPEGSAYAVYARPKGEDRHINDPQQSTRKLMQLIEASMKFPLIKGSGAWNEKVVKNARKLFGDTWRNEILHTSDE